MKKIFTLIFVSLYVATNIWAAKSAGTAMLVFQSDGQAVTIQLLGDEDFSWYQTIDGALLVFEGSEYYIAKVENGSLVSTGILAHDESDRTEAEIAAIAAQDKKAFLAQADNSVKKRRNAVARLDKKNFSPHMGEIHIPIILMNYTDKKFVLGNGDKEKLYEVFEEYFNGETRTPYTSETRFQGYSSVRQYFIDASNGKFTPVFDLYGPYETVNEHNYYGKANGKTSTLLKEAVACADDDIDFSKYDSNNDGNVDLVYVLYAGTGANLSGNRNDVWPACWYNRTITTKENKIVNVIGVANELAASSYLGEPVRAGIGVFCHEMSHGLGLPDLYWTLGYKPTDENGNVDFDNCGPEDWDIMDGGENLFNGMWPCQYTTWEREYMGWEDAEELIGAQNITLAPRNKGGKAYRITNPADPYEYYTIEHTGYDEWNYYLNKQYGNGMLIMHITSSPMGFSMTPNNIYGHPNVTLLPADGRILGYYTYTENPSITLGDYKNSLRADIFPGLNEVTSVESFKNYTGNDMVDGFGITDIVQNEDTTVTFWFRGGVYDLPDGKELADYPTETFGKINYTRNMSVDWGTVVVPFDVDYDSTNKDYTLYYLNGASFDELMFLEYPSGVIPAGTPMVVKKNSGDQIVISGTNTSINPVLNEAETFSNWKMKGTYTTQEGLSHVYFIAQNKFWWAENTVKVSPYRAWFDTTDTSYSRGKSMKISLNDGVSTAIYELTANTIEENADMYNLLGQKVNPRSGDIYITNGKKYMK
jgi:immune inhibitor A